MVKISQNHDDWATPEPPSAPPPAPTQTTKKTGIHVLNSETMQEAKKSLKEKGIKAEEVENLPPIEALCEPTTHPPVVEVHSLLDFNASDVPHNKPPYQCLDEFDKFIIKQTHFNTQVQIQLQEFFLYN